MIYVFLIYLIMIFDQIFELVFEGCGDKYICVLILQINICYFKNKLLKSREFNQ